MKPHLSERQMSEWSLGERSPEVERHADGCHSCRARLIRNGQALAAFRQSARQWSERELGAADVWAVEKARPWMMSGSLRWACAVAAFVLVFGGVSVVRRNHPPAPPDSAVADALLLKQIDTDVSQAVPDSMQPLLTLVSWNGAQSN